ncbi:MAG: FHA domain-containing protein, partial [Acidobacteria bacterium]|nr:FHA domain-containing protein [Acidobacteriota bacterium]
MPEIVIKPKASGIYTVPLEKVRTTLGRSSRNDVCLSDPFASRFHVEVRREGDDYFVADVGSANGTLLNGMLLARQTRLQPNDELRIGETTITFARESNASVASSTSILWTEAHKSQEPDVTIQSARPGRRTSGFLDSLRNTSPDVTSGTVSKAMSDAFERRDLLAVVSKVGVALL